MTYFFDYAMVFINKIHTHTHIYIYIYRYRYWVGPQRDLYFFRIYLFCSFKCLCFQFDTFIREHVWHKTLLMGYSMRLEPTDVCNLNEFQLIMSFLWKSLFSFSLECVSFSLLYSSFAFDIWYVVCMYVCMCICVCVHACDGVVLDFT